MSLKTVFIGAVEEGRECLEELISLDVHVGAIFTFTDEIAQKTSGAVSFDEIAERYSIPIYKVKSTNNDEVIDKIRKFYPDVIFVIGWTRLICSAILSIPPLGCIGMHASLLPKYRGRAPVNWVLINGEKETGNTAILLSEGVDTGKIIAQRKIMISFSDTCQSLYHKVANSGRDMIRELVPKLVSRQVVAIEQDETDAFEMPKRTPNDGLIDWSKSAIELYNWIRALTTPYPGAFTYLRNKRLLVWEARLCHYPYLDYRLNKLEKWSPGTIIYIDDGIGILTSDQAIITLHKLNFIDDDEMNWRNFVNKHRINVGEIFKTLNVG
jgi:methionyl-tRNA formyltransferase